ncbi:MAG: hypothetical protein EB084_23185 [Proteobacteria bacterium]|nr:hypothetical protein [Pseudomonadota bacterium]
MAAARVMAAEVCTRCLSGRLGETWCRVTVSCAQIEGDGVSAVWRDPLTGTLQARKGERRASEMSMRSV